VKEFSAFFSNFDFSKPDMSETFTKLKLPSSSTPKDYQYQYHKFSDLNNIFRIVYSRSVTMQNTMNSISENQRKEWKSLVNTIQGEIPELQTTIQTIAHLFSIYSSNLDFDLGMSDELLNMLGFSKQINWTRNKFKARQLKRHIINSIMRDQIQLKQNARSLVNAFFTKSNTFKSVDYNNLLDREMGRSSNSIIDGETLYLFKRLFMDNHLQLTDENADLYKQYIWFLNEHLKISNLPLITLTLIARGKSMHSLFPKDNVNKYFKTFYVTDPNIAKEHASRDLMHIWFDIDIITYLLWSCASEMPLLKPITADLPPKLNPMSQMWIYTNIVKETIVNNEFKKLLAVGNVDFAKHEKGTEHEIIFREPLFKHLGMTKIDEIEILIATKFGNPCPFADGPSTVQLRFEAETFVS